MTVAVSPVVAFADRRLGGGRKDPKGPGRAGATGRRLLFRGLCSGVSRLALGLIASLFAVSSARAVEAPALCAAIQRHADAAGAGPVFLASYAAAPGQPPLAQGIATSAFSYDNALAVIALVACGDVPTARRVGDALLLAATHDRGFQDGRIRNAYRAGPASDPPVPPGWWDPVAKRWGEDPVQDGTTTGNVAWVALALLTLDQVVDPAVGPHPYRAGAERLMTWVDERMANSVAPAGYEGGYDGFDATQQRLLWKSTEHNIDAGAAFAWLARLTGKARWRQAAHVAQAFVGAQWQPDDGHFHVGTQEDGHTPNLDSRAVDTQMWPHLAFPDAPAKWRRSLDWAREHMTAQGGYDFNDDRDGRWPEGTAQAALTLRLVGQGAEARRLLAVLDQDVAPNGLLYAASHDGLTTGLMVGAADGGITPLVYERRPHLGATAWAALAALGWNPFTGRLVPDAVATQTAKPPR